MTTFTNRCVVFLIVACSILLFFNLGQSIDPTESLVSVRLDVQQLEDGRYVYTEKGKSIFPVVLELGSDQVLDELKKSKILNRLLLQNRVIISLSFLTASLGVVVIITCVYRDYDVLDYKRSN